MVAMTVVMVGTLASKLFKPEKKKSKFFSGLKNFEARVPTITTAAVYQTLCQVLVWFQ